MNLISALDSFLHQAYGAFAAPPSPDQPVSGAAFYKNIILKAVQDPAFRAQLISNPAVTLKEHGIVLPEGVNVTFVENTKDTIHIVIPPFVGE
ncbi:MAG TPA: NHLP leader peptide family RiPP precursor [Candidatus Brocadiia bacterium]|nr:NHLP leader peptide family RiPP precursor [Candidatus Brocadiia bacterium]